MFYLIKSLKKKSILKTIQQFYLLPKKVINQQKRITMKTTIKTFN